MVDPLTGQDASRLGLYVHFPYCLAKCPYCDFAVTVAKEIPQARYADAVVRELILQVEATPELKGRQLDSVFFGGGTPSLWEPRYIEQILEGAAGAFVFAPEAEISLEANPERLDAERLGALCRAGISRLSLGVQSFEPTLLRALGRAHDAEAARTAVELARKAGFEDVSFDLIYGVQGQTLEQAVADARQALALQPEHLSTYVLTVDRPVLAEETPFAKAHARGLLALPSEDAAVAMSDAMEDLFEAHGYVRYEISNHARPGFHSRHNALYWTGGEYLGLGTGATGLRLRSGRAESATGLGTRTTNHRSAEKYLASVEAGALPIATSEPLTSVELFEERLAMGLRLFSGVDVEAICRAYQQPFEPRRTELQRLVAHGFAQIVADGRIALTRKGAHLHSEVSARLI